MGDWYKMMMKAFVVLFLGLIYSGSLLADSSDTSQSDEHSFVPTESLASQASPETSSAKHIASHNDLSESVIEPGDKIQIIVQGEPQLSAVYSVDSDSKISFPLLGSILIENQTINQLRTRLQEALGKEYLINPQVEITVQESIANSVNVLGSVAKPGSYLLGPNMTALKLITQAGGFADSADYSIMKIVRDVDGKVESTVVNVENILSGEAPDPAIYPGDMLFVPKIANVHDKQKDLTNVVSVLGQVQRPNNYENSSGITLVKIISQAGGLTRTADASKVRITRRVSSGKKVFVVNVGLIIDGKREDMKLEAGDIVYVPESIF